MAPGSPAAAAGLAKDDQVISIGGQLLHDVIDYQFYLEPGASEIEIEREGRRQKVRIELMEDQDPGIA